MRITVQAKQENRALILEKAADLFATKGFEETTIRDIASATGMATGTLFNYFPTKETLAMTMVKEALHEGVRDFKHRRTGVEDLNEDLFLFVASGLRRLRPLRPFLGPVLERSLSPFPRKMICPEGEETRKDHLRCLLEIIGRHAFSPPPDDVLFNVYWSLYLGILAFWTSDSSPNQERSQALIDYSLNLFVRMISGNERGDGHGD